MPADVSEINGLELAKCFVEGDTDGGCEVKAPDILIRHRNRETPLGVRLENVLGKATSFGSEHETVAVLKAPRCIRRRRLRREIQES